MRIVNHTLLLIRSASRFSTKCQSSEIQFSQEHFWKPPSFLAVTCARSKSHCNAIACSKRVQVRSCDSFVRSNTLHLALAALKCNPSLNGCHPSQIVQTFPHDFKGSPRKPSTHVWVTHWSENMRFLHTKLFNFFHWIPFLKSKHDSCFLTYYWLSTISKLVSQQ